MYISQYQENEILKMLHFEGILLQGQWIHEILKEVLEEYAASCSKLGGDNGATAAAIKLLPSSSNLLCDTSLPMSLVDCSTFPNLLVSPSMACDFPFVATGAIWLKVGGGAEVKEAFCD